MLHVVLTVVVICLLIGLANYLLKDYIDAGWLGLANKVAVAGIVLYIILFVLGMLGYSFPALK